MKKAYFLSNQPSYMNWDVCFNTGGEDEGGGSGGNNDGGAVDKPVHERPDGGPGNNG